jgi:hypothetical protein
MYFETWFVWSCLHTLPSTLFLIPLLSPRRSPHPFPSLLEAYHKHPRRLPTLDLAAPLTKQRDIPPKHRDGPSTSVSSCQHRSSDCARPRLAKNMIAEYRTPNIVGIQIFPHLPLQPRFLTQPPLIYFQLLRPAIWCACTISIRDLDSRRRSPP